MRAAALEEPGRDALIVAGRALSYAKLAERVVATAEGLHGLEPGDVLALTPRLALPSLLRIWACLERHVPMLLLHPRLTSLERQRAVDYATEALGRAPREWPADAARATGATSSEPAHVLAYVFTSGTTGAPRAVTLSRGALQAAARASAEHLGWREDDRWLLSLTPAHVGGLSILIRALAGRRALVLADDASFEPELFARQLERDRVTLLSLVPTMLRRLLDHDPEWRPPSSLRAVLLGGAAAPQSLRCAAHERGLPIMTTYGMTETCAQVVTQAYARRGEVDAGVGQPLSGVQLRVRDGHVEVHTDAMMDGYLGVFDAGQPFTEDGWLRTADAGRLRADGTLEIHGRVDDVIVSGGENVSPWEVEAALLSIPGVLRAVVFGQPDDEWGECVCAAVVFAADGPDLARLAVGLRERLAAHKLPRWVASLEDLPPAPKGGVDRRSAAKAAIESGLSPMPRIAST